MSVIVDVIINTDQAEQQLQDLQQQIANDLAQGAARIGTTAGQAATATARAAGKNATEEFLRAFDPDKLKAELESAGLDEQQIEIILETTAAKAETQKLKDTIASAFGEASGFATDALKQITAQAAREVDRSKGKVKSVTEIVDGVRDLKDELKQVGGASDAAAEGIGQLVLNETVDKFGDLKDIFEKTGVALGGLSQEAVDAVVKIGDIAEKGASVGAAFGPMGAAIGLVAGGILGAFNAAAEEAAKKAAEMKSRIDETTQAIVDIGTAAGTGGQSIEQLTDLQAKLATELATKTYPALGEYQIQLRDAEEAVRSVAEEQSSARSAAQKLADAQTTGASAAARLQMKQEELAQAQENLKNATDALNKAKEASLVLDYQLGRSAEGVLKDLRSRYDLLTKGNPLLKMSVKELEAEVAKLDKQYNELAISAQSAGERSFLKGEGGQTAAEEATAAAEAFTKLSEATALLESKRQQSNSTTSASTKATTEDTKAKQATLKPLTAIVTKFDELVALEKDHEDFLKRQKQTAAEGLFGMDYLDNLANSTRAASEKVSEETTDLIKMIDLGGRTVAEKVQDDIDALREAKAKAAKEFTDDLLFDSFVAGMDARMKATADAVERYKEIMQPYADFVGNVFNTFVDGLAEGQSATEAFAKGVQQAVASALAALAKEFGVKSLGALAEGFAALSNPFTAAAAPGFFKSAALYAAAAAAAGVGSAVVSSAGGQGAAPNVGGGGGGVVSSSGGVGGTSNSLGGGSQQSTGTPSPIVVDLRGAVFPTSDLTGAQQFGEAVARSLAAAAAGNQPLARRLIGTRGFVV